MSDQPAYVRGLDTIKGIACLTQRVCACTTSLIIAAWETHNDCYESIAAAAWPYVHVPQPGLRPNLHHLPLQSESQQVSLN